MIKRICFSALLIFVCVTMSVAVSAQQSLAVEKRTLENGVTVLVKPEPGTGLVSVVAAVKAGAAQEGFQIAGIGNFVAKVLLAGTRMNSAEDVAAIADIVGGNVETRWDSDLTEIRVITTAAMFNKAMSLVGDCLSNATFEEKWVESARKDLLSQINAESDDVFQNAYTRLRSMLYQDNGYKRSISDFKRTVSEATADDLRKFYEMYYVPNNIVLSVVGDVTVDQALDRANKAFAGIPAKKLPIDRGVPDEKLDRSKQYVSEVKLNIAYMMVGWLAPGASSPDYPAMLVAANALGAGKGSMMFRELRQKQGIGYPVGALYPRMKNQSHVVAYIITDPFKLSFPQVATVSVLDDVKAGVMALTEKLKNERLTDEELKRARGYTIGSYILSKQHIMDRAHELAWLEVVGVGYERYKDFPDRIEVVTAEDVQRVARKYFTDCSAVLLLPRNISPPSGSTVE